VSQGNELKEQTAFQELRRFLFDNVATYDDLEVLLLLQRRPELDWTVNAAAELLGLSTDACQQALETLAAKGLAAIGGSFTFRYAPASKELAASAQQLQRAYVDDRFAIIQLMTTNAMDRVRAAALGRLGEALQLRDTKKLR
jgi:DNA-binding IclR family transcriptional regulator